MRFERAVRITVARITDVFKKRRSFEIGTHDYVSGSIEAKVMVRSEINFLKNREKLRKDLFERPPENCPLYGIKKGFDKVSLRHNITNTVNIETRTFEQDMLVKCVGFNNNETCYNCGLRTNGIFRRIGNFNIS